MDIIDRLECCPEDFVLNDRYFIQRKGQTVLVRGFNGWLWHLCIDAPGGTCGYYRPRLIDQLRIYAATRHMKKTCSFK